MVRRLVPSSVGVSILVFALVMPTMVLGSNASPATSTSDTVSNGCQGIVNAYAHVSANVARNGNNGNALAALSTVADRLGCDLSAPPPATANKDPYDVSDGADTTNQPDADKPPSHNDKCDKIAAKLAAAQANPHGKSADAFARQADHWGCPAD